MYLFKLFYSNQINKTNTQRFLKINISPTFHFIAGREKGLKATMFLQ